MNSRTNIHQGAIIAGRVAHVENLGRTIQHIAWHKSGSFRDGVLAFSVPQVQEAKDEIERRAEQQGAILQFVGSVKGSLVEILEIDQVEDIPLEQQENCALATKIAHGFLQRSRQSLDRRDVLAGVQTCYWAGRFDIKNSGGCTWYLDGAHDETSMEVVAKWYERMASPRYIPFVPFATASE
jgi:folylpolyglutamate synthase